MRKSLRYGLIALSGVVALAVVLPMALVDEAAIKREIARAVENRTGRTLEIQGDLSFSLLPTPRLSAEGVRLANWPDSAEPWMVEVAKVSATLSPLDLLGGEFVARTIELDRPRVLLERRAGRANWNFVPSGQLPDRVGVRSGGLISAANAQSADADDDRFGFRRLSVHGGRLAYRDAGGGRSVDVDAVRLDLDADGSAGPFRGNGSASIGGRAIAFDGDSGRIQGGRAVPIHLNARTGGLAAKFDGLLLRETDAGAVFKASAEISAADAAAVLGEWGVAAPAQISGRPFALGGQLRLDAASGDFEEGQLRLGPANAAAGAHWTLDGPRPRVSLRLAARALDLDAWAAQRAVAVPGFALVAAASAAEPAAPLALPLPKDVDVAFDLSAASVLWRGQAAQSVVAEGEVSRGDLVLNQVSAELPGAAQVRAFGFVGTAMRSLDLTVQASAANLRGVLDWLGADVSGVPSDRLRRAGLAAQISGGKDDLLRVRDIDLALDASRAKGALDLRWGPRPAFGLSLAVDQLNLDAYRPQPTRPVASAAPARATPAVAGDLPPAPAPWQGFDANLDLSVGRLTVGGQPLDRVSAKGAWQGGVLDLATLSADLGGAGHLRGSGKIRTIGEGAPRFEAVKADVTTPRADRLLGLLPFDAPAFTLDWRALTATLAADGPLADLKLDASARLGDVSANLSGRFDGVKGRPAADGELRLASPTLGALARAFGGDLAPELANKGKVSVVAPIAARDTGYAVPALAVSAGDIAISGSAEVRTDGPRPFAKITLEGNTLPWIAGLDLPAGPRLAAAPTQGFLPVAAPAAAKAPAWAPLRDFDGELTAKFDSVVAPKLRADKVEAALHLNQGIATLDRAAARLLGGEVSANGRADLTGAAAKLDGRFEAKGVTVASNSPLFGGNAPIAGRVDLTAEGASTGNDRDALLRGLGGKGTLSVTQGSFAGANLGAVNERLNRIRNLQDILGALDAGSRGRTAFDSLTGSFVIEKGVLRSNDLALAAPAGVANAKGSADLAAETLDADLRFTLDNLKEAPPLGIKLAGAWAAPRVVFDTNAFQQHVLKKGLGDFLKSLSKPQSGEPPAPAAVKPKDVLREILAPIPQSQP